MATLSHTESRRLYSWWWDSHISPKNSKWLQENLTDMDAKVKAMIKLIEEDADSFARRAEMYYKKRPELMKLVEEFYRAYRALAERYDYATGELRQAHRTMAEAFPNQVPFVLADDSPAGSSTSEAEPHTPEMPHPIRALFDPDDLHKDALGISSSHVHDTGTSKKGLKQLNEIFGSGDVAPHHTKLAEGRARKGLNFHNMEEKERSLQDGVSQLSTENQNLKTQVISNSERVGKAEAEVQTLREALSKLEAEKEAALIQFQQSSEKLSNLETEVSRAEEDMRGLHEHAKEAKTEVQTLKEALAKLEAEKEVVLLQYQQSLEMLSNLKIEVSRAQEDARRLDERTNKAETEVQTLKEALAKLEAEKGAVLLQCQQYLEMISNLETKISHAQEDAARLNERASKADIEAQTLKQALVRLEAEKEAGLLQYKQCLERIPSLETKISFAEEDARKFNEQADKAETEVQTLKQAVAKSEEEKEAAALQYQQCLEKVSILETEISRAQDEARRLNDEIMMGVMKLDRAEEKCLLLERENQSLHSEVESLVQKTGMQNQELSEKHGELERLRICIQEARLRFLQAEAAIQTLENLHTRSQDEKTALALELQNEAQMLKDIELRNYCLEDEVKRFKEENTSLNEQNLSSAMSIKNLQEEIFSLKAMERKLEGEVEFRVDQRNALQQEIYCLREEINDLNRKHQVIMEQVESVGLDPEYIGSSVKELQDENSKLKQRYQKENDEKVGLLEKLKNMERLMERNTLLENSLSDVNAELEGLREKLKTLEESFQTLQGEKSTLVVEKATLASQLETITDNMKKLSEEKTSLETSLSVAIVELEGLREKSKSLEESYQSLDNENSGLLSERDTLVSQLESIRQRLDDLEKRYAKLEEKYLSQEKEKEFIHCQVEELRDSLNLEKQERANSTQLSEIRLVRLENQICLLQEEGQWRKRDFEEELDKAVKAHVEIFILQSCMRDMEEKNISLLIECQKHFEASKLSEKLISELEQENLEQQEEVKSLLDQIKKLTTGIHQMLKLLEIDPNHGSGDKIKEDQTLVQHILGKFDDMKSSLLENQDQKQHLLVEKLVFDTLLRQLRVEAADLELERNTLDQELKTRTEDLLTLQSEKHRLLELNEQLRSEVVEGDCREVVLKAGMENLCLKLSDLQEGHVVLVNENSKLLEDNCSLMKEFSDLNEEKCMLEEENCVILGEAMALDNLSLIFKSFAADKAVELKGLNDDLDHVSVDNCGLEKEVTIMKEKLGKVGTENLFLKESVEQLENELNTVRNASDQLNHQMAIGKDLLIQKEREHSEAEQKLNAAKSENAELNRDLEVLKRENDEAKVKRDELEKQILELSEDNSHQKKEIGYLHEMNGKVGSELGKLSEEIEELRTREGSLNSELQERRHEVELWEAEASTFYDDLHISTVRETLFKDKIHELTGACVSLEDEAASKNVEIEQLKERVSILGSENEGLKAEMIAYLPVIVSLRDSIASLEDHAILQTNRHMGDKQKPTDAKLASHQLSADQNTIVPGGVLELQQLQTRVKAVESTMLEMENFAMEHIVNKTIKLDAAMKEIEELKSKNSSDNLKLLKTESETSEVRNGLLLKDIPLDQISDGPLYDHGLHPNGMSRRENGKTDDTFEFWETAEGSCSLDLTVTKAQKLASALIQDDTECHQMGTVEEQKRKYRSSKLQGEKELGVDKLEVSKKVLEPRREGSKRKILERLDSDAQKLMNLQVTLHDLKTKVETSEKTKKAKGAEYDTVKRQLEEVEAAIMQLVGLNGKLMRNAEEESLLSSSNSGKASTDLEEPGNVRRRRVLEQARRGSEKIGRLQLEMQRIQFVLLKLEAENERKGKIGVTERRSKVLLRDYIYGGRDYIYYGGRSSNRRKKASFCACAQPSTKEE